MKLQKIKEFIISVFAPPFFLGVVTTIFRAIPLLSNYWLYPFVVLAFISLIRFSIERKFNLVKKYCSLMGYLEPLVCIGNTCNKTISNVVKDAYAFPPRPSPCWKIYFELSFKNVDTQFNKLNTNLNKLKNFPYWLLCSKNTDLIRHDFTELFSDMETLYKSLYLTRYDYTIGNGIDFVEIGNVYNDFVQKLKDSRQEFEEIKNDIPKISTFQELLI